MKLLVEQINKIKFKRAVKAIINTPPISVSDDDDITIVTLVHKAALHMYIAAIKSFMINFGRGNVKILSDGSLSDEDKQLIKEHVHGAEIKEMSSIDMTGFPKGGCWERLLYVIELSKHSYVIQIDSDTLTLGAIPEIVNAVNLQRGFCIGNPVWPEMIPASYMSFMALQWQSTHVQALAESAFEKLAFFDNGKKYLRGCAAVTGFPKGQVNRELLREFSEQITQELGCKKWNEWGSEQVASNVMIAQTNEPLILPWPRYQNFDFPRSEAPIERQALIHFIGSNRFNRGVYRRAVNKLIDKLAARGLEFVEE